MHPTTLKNSKNKSFGKNEEHTYDMIVFCHLRWDFVYQRPQHIISRMAKQYKVLFIEEPWMRENEKESRLIKLSDMLHVLQPNVNSIAEIKDVLPQFVSNTSNIIGWFYSPSFVPIIDYFDFSTIIYDCMDELSLFKEAPEKIIEQEKYLIAQADLVFTGGKSLYESKAKLHKNVHCFPSSVDQSHFAHALNSVAIPADIASIPSPLVGYFGVIDERIDLTLLREVASRRTDVSFVMIGPIAKINQDDLPKGNNIHYLGMKDYKDLPAYLKAFDLAMMPFALNDATKFISPTKTLEYMAAYKPIASTAITDVVSDYGHCISIVHNIQDFEKAIDTAMHKMPDAFMHHKYNMILAKTSWDNTVAAMQLHLKATKK